MIASDDTLRSRWLAATAAITIAALCRVLGCANIVEEPSSNVDATSHSGLVSSSNSSSGSTTVTSSASASATMGLTASTSATTTGTSLGTSAVTTGGSSVTTAESSGTSTSESSTVASATASNDATGSTNSVTTGSSSITTSTSGTGGMGGATASTSAASVTTTGGSEFCEDARTPAQNTAAEGNTGSFQTYDGVCYRLDFAPADFAGWGCSNFAANAGNRTILVNGASVTCGELPLPDPVAGGYYFDFGPGANVTAAMYWWNWQ